MSKLQQCEAEFDLKPDPRILPMLGEINLLQWRCLAELIDNAVDGFLAASRRGEPINSPCVTVNIPTADMPSARVVVRDNGPGMDAQTLEMAVRAGWSGNNPIDSLGMFGMGFNIATARLGTVTTVWTVSREDAEWHGLQIDFEALQKQRHFRTPHLTRPKSDPAEHGTEVAVERLKADQRAWLAKTANKSRTRKELSKAYSAMLRSNGAPISFELRLNGEPVRGIDHCVWDENRFVETPRHGPVQAIQMIDRSLPDRPFCTACWQWLPANENLCPSCGSSSNVARRTRHVYGWIGLQRYLSSTNYGIDLIRNGRKIEIGNRDLFAWRDDESTEVEYPIDDPRNRGRFVGEIHLDHCRVTYTKDRFDRTDPAWEEMVRIVRGDGPLRPDKASAAGYGPNASPLFRLFQAFRRSSPPKARTAGGWARVLVVKDNDRAEEMARKFYAGEPEYQTDEKWWELIEEEDNRLLTPPGMETDGGLPGFSAAAREATPPVTQPPSSTPSVTAPTATRTPIPSLTREYRHDRTNLRWDVKAFQAESCDPELVTDRRPWRLRRRTSGEDEFLVDPRHPIFQSMTMTELDGLLCELAWSAVDFTRANPDRPAFSSVLADLRERYAGTLKLDVAALSAQADMVFMSIARSWSGYVDTEDCLALFNELTSNEQEFIYHKMAVRSVLNPQEIVSGGRFLEYAPLTTLIAFVINHPELFFDGRCWEDAYSELDFPQPAAAEEARSRLVRYYETLLLDVSWISELEADDLSVAPRERLLRAALAIELLVPVSGTGTGQDE